MKESRTHNTKRNIITGVGYKFVTILLPFLIRTAILYILGEQYVGLSSLFTSILQVLNLAELGFSSAIIYNMYKPIADGNESQVCKLMAYYKKIYTIIGAVILVVGAAIMPLIPRLINGTWPNDINIYLLYALYLINTSVSYFMFAYKSALLNALQRMDLVNLVLMFVNIAKYIIQLAVIILFKNFYIYVIIGIFASVLNNIVTAYISDKKYPQYKPAGKLNKSDKAAIREQIAGLMIGKLSDTSRNSFDNIVISMYLGLTSVAIYNNYYYVYSSVYGVVLIITQAMQASAGNSIAAESKDKNYEDLKKFQFIFAWIITFCTICMFCLYQPFMKVWAGDALMLNTLDMSLFCLYFYAINMNNMRNLYFVGNGLWWHGRVSFVLEAICNLILNFALGKIWGITGIIIATIITILVFNFISRTNILFKKYFMRSPNEFYKEHVKYFGVLICVGLITYMVCSVIKFDNLIGIVFRLIICCIVPNIIMLLLYRKSNYFKYSFNLAKRLISGRG